MSMATTTIRVSEPTRERFAELARKTGRPMSRLVEEAADALERKVFFDQMTARYESLSADPTAWDEIEAERALEAGALRDRAS